MFRADASLQIGSGHVMRCLTLADALSSKGVHCHFICRDLVGNLVDLVRARGYEVSVLPGGNDLMPDIAHARYRDSDARRSKATQLEDAQATAAMLTHGVCDWLVVDHYALDQEWERAIRRYFSRLLVIDDLADRHHDCDVLVNQNLGRTPSDYTGLVPRECSLLVGTRYALLRPEFAELREYSIRRRSRPRLKHLLLSMGGVDQDDATGAVLEALKQTQLPNDCAITVVMGLRAPWLEKVKAQATAMPWPCDVRVNVSGMARIIAESDLVIGAVGGTSWERCCLGAPSLIVVLAENQRFGAAALQAAGGALLLGDVKDIPRRLPNAVMSLMVGDQLRNMSESSAAVCDGQGLSRVLKHMYPERSVGVRSDGGCRLRPMRWGDLQNVLGWRNSPEVRRHMYSQHKISESEHQDWFERASTDMKRRLLIAEDEGGALGFVQFTQHDDGNAAVWGFYTVPGSPRGTGRRMGHAALDYAFRTLDVRRVIGEALATNEASIHFHRALGFTEQGVRERQNYDGTFCCEVHTFEMLAEQWSHMRKE